MIRTKSRNLYFFSSSSPPYAGAYIIQWGVCLNSSFFGRSFNYTSPSFFGACVRALARPLCIYIYVYVYTHTYMYTHICIHTYLRAPCCNNSTANALVLALASHFPFSHSLALSLALSCALSVALPPSLPRTRSRSRSGSLTLTISLSLSLSRSLSPFLSPSVSLSLSLLSLSLSRSRSLCALQSSGLLSDLWARVHTHVYAYS